MEVSDTALAQMFATVLPLLDERQRRVLAGAQAIALGRGGIGVVSCSAGMARSTVQRAVGEVRSGVAPAGRVRRLGAGRKKLIDKDEALLFNLDDLVEPEARGDPMCPLRWTAKSTGNLADALWALGHQVSPDTVGRLLHEMGYSLQATAKQRAGDQHPDRDGQFVYLCAQVADHLKSGDPVISVDTKKKELVGQRFNGAQEYQPTGQPERVEVHDFPDPEVPKAIPYGVYDIGANEGFVSVGDDHDTAAFAVATIERWWETMGRQSYPRTTRLLVTADAGGSHGHRVRLWKLELSHFAEKSGLAVTVCHFPPGTSKWNQIEHRLWSQVSMNWPGRPLTSHEVMVQLIGATTTATGLKVRAELDQGYYPKGMKITKKELDAVPLERHAFHGDWNYTVLPAPPDED